jgi:ankyrin repeat protein
MRGYAAAVVISVWACADIPTAAEHPLLVDAVKDNDMPLVAQLLAQKVDVNVPRPDGSTALHWAAHWDSVDLIGALIRAGANVRAADDLGVTPLLVACTNGTAAIVTRLLEAGADANAVPVSGETPLMMAARSGSLDAVRALVAHGSNVNAEEPLQRQTVLMWAAAHDQPNVIELLVRAGADLDARTKTQKSTPLMFAARQGALNAASMLLDLGAQVNDADVDGNTPLLAAVTLGHFPLARVLLESGADPNIDAAGYTALHWVSGAWEGELSGRYGSDKYLWMAGLGEGKRELVEALLAHGANPNARIVKAPPRIDYENVRTRLKPVGATPFLLAAHAGRTDIMRILLARRADPLATTADNTTPLMAAAGFGRMNASSRVLESDAIEAARLTLALGNNIHAANDQGETALHAASYAGWNNMIQFLVENGARVNEKNKRGWTALTIAEGFLDVTTGSVPSFHPETAILLRKLGGVSYKTDTKPVDGR